MAEEVILELRVDEGKTRKNLEAVTDTIRMLKEEQKRLKEAFDAGKISQGEYAAAVDTNKDKIKQLTATQKAYIQQLQVETKANAALGTSLREQAAHLTALKNQYRSLDKEQRESAGGQAMLKKIQDLDREIKAADATMGDYQRNVGNYPKTWEGVIPSFNKVEGLFKSLGVDAMTLSDTTAGGFAAIKNAGVKSLSTLGQSVKAFSKTLLTTPIGWIAAAVGVLIGVFTALKKQFDKNDAAGTAVKKLFASLRPIFDAITAVLDTVVTWLGKLADGLANIIARFSGATASAQDLVTAYDDLQEAERRYVVASAERSKEIARLRAESADTKNLKDRKKLLEEAQELERKELEERKTIAAEKRRLLEEEAQRSRDTSDETADKIAQARAAELQAEEAYYTGVRKLNKELQSVEAAAAKEREDARRKELEEKRKAEEARIAAEKARAKTSQEIAQAAEDFALSLIGDETARAIAEYEIRGKREIDKLKERFATDETLTAESRDQLNQLIIDKQAQLDVKLDEMAAAAAAAKEEEEFEQEREKAARLLSLRLDLAAEGSEQELELKKEQLSAQMDAELAATEATEEEKNLIRQKFAKEIADLDAAYNKRQEQLANSTRERYKGALRATASEAANTFGAMSDLLAEYGEQNAAAAKASKAFALAGIITDQAVSIANTAKAISSAVAGAAEAAAAGGPLAPVLIAAYTAQMVGAVIAAVGSLASSFTQARGLMSQADDVKAATGGIVTGRYDARDSVRASLSGGEMVLNPAQQLQLFELANSSIKAAGIDYDLLGATMAAAVSELPAPVMDYAEFTTFSRRVTNYTNIATL